MQIDDAAAEYWLQKLETSERGQRAQQNFLPLRVLRNILLSAGRALRQKRVDQKPSAFCLRHKNAS